MKWFLLGCGVHVYMHGSIVTSNLRVGSISLALIQNVTKGNNYCILFCCIFSSVWHFLWVGRKMVWCCSFFSHFSCHLAVGRLSPGTAGMGETQKRPSRKCKWALKTCITQNFGKTPEPFTPFPVSSPSSGKLRVYWRHFCVFLVAGVPQPVLQCHLPIAGQDSGGSSPCQSCLCKTLGTSLEKMRLLWFGQGEEHFWQTSKTLGFFFFSPFSYPAT